MKSSTEESAQRPSGTAGTKGVPRSLPHLVVLLALVLTGCTSDADPTDPSTKPAAGPDSEPTPTPTETHTTIDPVQRNGQVTSAERYLGARARTYRWRSFDPVSETGLFVTWTESDRSHGFDGLEVVGPTGPVATLTCARDLRCSPDDDWVSYTATLGPGADEVTVESGDGTVQVIGYDGTLRRTLDLGETITGGGQVRGVRWSPDGSLLAVVTGQDLDGTHATRVWLVDAEGGDAQVVYSLSYDGGAPTVTDSGTDAGEGGLWTAGNWGWSPDGQTLLLDVYRGLYASDVVVLHLQSDGAVDPVIDQTLYRSDRHFDHAGNVAWSPDGTRIAVRTRTKIVEISAEEGSVLARHPHLKGWLIWPRQED